MSLKRSDVLSIAALLVVLGALFLPGQSRHRANSARVACLSNLKQIGLSFRIYANLADPFPTSVSTNFGGAREAVESGQVWKVFQVLSRYELPVPKTAHCVADNRSAAISWTAMGNSNVSYFVAMDAHDTKPDMLLTGDRNLALDGELLTGVVALGTNSPLTWTKDMHREKGNIGLADGSVQQVTTELLRQQLKNSGDPTNLLVFPQ